NVSIVSVTGSVDAAVEAGAAAAVAPPAPVFAAGVLSLLPPEPPPHAAATVANAAISPKTTRLRTVPFIPIPPSHHIWERSQNRERAECTPSREMCQVPRT